VADRPDVAGGIGRPAQNAASGCSGLAPQVQRRAPAAGALGAIEHGVGLVQVHVTDRSQRLGRRAVAAVDDRSVLARNALWTLRPWRPLRSHGALVTLLSACSGREHG